MIKCEVIENFTLEKFNQLKNVNKVISRKDNEFGVKDTFECDKEMADYLLGNNVLNKKVVKVVEVELPKVDVKKIIESAKDNKEIVESIKEKPKIIETIETSVGTFGYEPVEVKETKLKTPKKKKTSKKKEA